MSDQDRRNRDEHDPREKHDERGRNADAVTRRDAIGHRPNPDRRGRWLAAIVGILGGWLLVQAVWFEPGPARLWNDIAVGTALLAAGAYNLYRRSNGEFASAGVAMLAALLGLWLVATPFLFGPDPGGSGADGIVASMGVVVGLLVFAASAYSAYAIRARRRNADPRPTAVYDRRGQ